MRHSAPRGNGLLKQRRAEEQELGADPQPRIIHTPEKMTSGNRLELIFDPRKQHTIRTTEPLVRRSFRLGEFVWTHRRTQELEFGVSCTLGTLFLGMISGDIYGHIPTTGGGNTATCHLQRVCKIIQRQHFLSKFGKKMPVNTSFRIRNPYLDVLNGFHEEPMIHRDRQKKPYALINPRISTFGKPPVTRCVWRWG